jgi:hypothetical protein
MAVTSQYMAVPAPVENQAQGVSQMVAGGG